MLPLLSDTINNPLQGFVPYRGLLYIEETTVPTYASSVHQLLHCECTTYCTDSAVTIAL